MADKRTVVHLTIPQDPAAVQKLHEEIVKLLTSERYDQRMYDKQKVQEVVWNDGDGFVEPMRYIKLDYQPGELIVSAWICTGMIFPKEHSLEGFYGIVPKRRTQATVNAIADLVQSFTQGAAQQQS
ncbi:MAG: hypothetical protein IIY93_02145 [Clostridia bacterium]|jgi:hypothetical protein|nr:hypothetical protein [Clostridia bacterium]MBQ1554164.1 hypothetical protein [Clostridia bacterium]MBQ5545105.1 hypothetical protein [Clostridia bacterium]